MSETVRPANDKVAAERLMKALSRPVAVWTASAAAFAAARGLAALGSSWGVAGVLARLVSPRGADGVATILAALTGLAHLRAAFLLLSRCAAARASVQAPRALFARLALLAPGALRDLRSGEALAPLKTDMRMSGGVKRVGLQGADFVCVAVGEQPIEATAVALKLRALVEHLAEGVLLNHDLLADADLAAELLLEIGRSGEMIGVDMRLDQPLDLQLLSVHESDDFVGRLVGNAASVAFRSIADRDSHRDALPRLSASFVFVLRSKVIHPRIRRRRARFENRR